MSFVTSHDMNDDATILRACEQQQEANNNLHRLMKDFSLSVCILVSHKSHTDNVNHCIVSHYIWPALVSHSERSWWYHGWKWEGQQTGR